MDLSPPPAISICTLLPMTMIMPTQSEFPVISRVPFFTMRMPAPLVALNFRAGSLPVYPVASTTEIFGSDWVPNVPLLICVPGV